ncbi:hypothetical protein LWI29_022149 [Acer saccharum]|uniref:Reverse transcriptase domain-containing protein n=1 Tax=Acer saccharum TaxID=4024 RepID=A0AA39SUL7_ACESA|nr:hypothetical protein LWI29_022149 [Acer saccharum]
MNNDSDRDGNSSGDLVVEPTAPTGDRAVTIGEQSAATPGTRAADPGILQHFQATLVNLISEASKIGLSLPIGLGVSSPYELTTPGIHPPGRLRSEVHIVIPDTQARQSTEETPQDHTEDFEGRKQRKGKGMMNEESREERDQVRTHGVNSNDTHQRNRRRHRSISSEDKSPRPRRELRSKRAKQRRSESTEDRRSPDERGNHGRMTIRSRLDPAGELTGHRDVILQELSRKVSAMARRYGRNVFSDDESDSPFIETIARTQFPDRFRMPTIEQYKENRDPKEHSSPIPQYYGPERNESIKKYLARFGKEVAQIEDASDVAVIAAFTNGLQSGRLSFDLRRDRPKTYEEMMEIAGDYALAEEEEVAQGGSYVHGHKPDSKSDHKDDKKMQSCDRQKDEKGQKGYSRESRGNTRANKFRGRYNHYTPLTGDQEEILFVVEDKGLAKYPRQQSANARRDTTKYCRFHKDHGHETSKCFQLRDHIESLIRDGHLKDFALKGDKHDGRQGNGQDRKSPRRNSPNTTINTIFGGPHTEEEQSRKDRNPKKGREGHDPITFTVEDSNGIDAKPNDAIVVGVRIAHRDVLRVMIDNGSSADILSARVYDELRLDRKDLEPFHVPLKGFEGAEVRSLGTVKLPVRFGTAPCRRTILLDFVVVDIHNWPYNALLGRPFLNKARAITSTHALKIKFPTEFGVGELRGSQEMARRTNLSIFKDKAGMETLNIFEVDREEQEDNPENFELDPRDKTSREKEEPTELIILDETEPDKTVKIGARLTEQVKKDMMNLLKEYRGIFAWCHEDMPGIDRSVISHNLAVNEKCKPVMQKRRSFNPKRSAAIKEEVSKLLAAGSIREVKYPEWVANVVLVKKKNNQWRMCVDFTDLNKACPKDSFPLPRIDQLVDATAGHETLSFMDAYSGYNQIKMHKPNEEKTAFTTDQRLYCYTVMPFGHEERWGNLPALGQQNVRQANKEKYGGLR